MKKIKTYRIFNESLRDKLKGKSKEEIVGGVDSILDDIAKELVNRKFFLDYNDAHKFIKDRYMDELLNLLDQAIKDADDNTERAGYYGLSYEDIKRLIILSFEEDYDDKIFTLHNESLRDKMRGPSDSRVDKGIERILREVVDEIQHSEIPDEWKSYDFISKNYTDWILDAIEEGHPVGMYSEVLIDQIEDQYYNSDEYLSTNESLRDKLKGKSDEDTDKYISILIKKMSKLFVQYNYFNDEDEAFKYIYENYLDWIIRNIEKGHSTKTIIDSMLISLKEKDI